MHNTIATEMKNRGFLHNTPIELSREAKQQVVDYRRNTNREINLAMFNESDNVDAFEEYLLVRRKLKFDYQHHCREKSGDMKFHLQDKKSFEEYTLSIQNEEELKKPLEKTKAVRKKVSYNNNYKTGKTDEGFYELGANKPLFREYFMDGKIFKGRYLFRNLPATKNIKDTGKEQLTWFFWKPEDQTPYILSTRALKKQDFMLDQSWLPIELEMKIPSELRWWEKDLASEEVTEMIKEARKKLMAENQLPEELQKKTSFILDRHSLKDQKVVVKHWDLRFSNGREWTLGKNPVFDPKDINAVYRKDYDIDNAFTKKEDREIKPGFRGNPNKKISAFVDTIEEGPMEFVSDSEDFMSVEFNGKQLKGFFTFKRLDKGEQWLMTKGKLPQAMSICLSDFEIEHILDLSDPQLNNSRPDIARQVGCSPTAVYTWQKRAGL